MVDLLKDITKNYIDDSKPTAVMFGTITSKAPLKVTIEGSKLVLGDSQLMICQRLTNQNQKLTFINQLEVQYLRLTREAEIIEHDPKELINTAGASELIKMQSNIEILFNAINNLNIFFANSPEHKVNNKFLFNVGDKLILVRKSGGQKFLIVDVIGNLHDIEFWG